ncbi:MULTISPECIES: ABC transporter substrate-binding protein [unclassified Chelatococcus]|uniref:ABC transporter substrate-binding protein n=1 Tax=unclassified Chelatococcus TaxID=2638111 RepID=UPI001BCDD530|nr:MULTISPECIES: ABC transporter substrate-binding protein [unclassified Chelatococcus]MBS7701505.1 ABC transporter substrate-binding protein [Chelatococcus sp. YT9]MBX3556884.1 ABC transporter substrate-binding protein [Chelatococcus sp.]
MAFFSFRMVLAASTVLATIGSAAAIDVVDQRGQTLSFDKEPAKVATIPIPAASMYVLADSKPDRLVAMNPTALGAITGEWLGRIYPGLEKVRTDIVKGGQFTPNVEALLTLSPDLVFQWANQGPDLIAPIERAGMKVFGQNYGTQAFLEETMVAMGKLTGQTDKTSALLDKHRGVMASLEKTTGAIPEADRPKVIYFQYFTNSLRPNGVGSYNDMYLKLAGGRNGAEGVRGTGTDVTFEQVLAWAPEVIILGGFDQAVPGDLYKDPKWASVPAVRNKRVYKMPIGGYRWDPPNVESPLAWIWVASILHPDKVGFNLRAEMDGMYKLLYGRAPTDEETKAILKASANADAKDYARVLQR